MTIASQTSRVSYVGDGVTTAFAVPFYWQANTDIKVYLQNSSGTQTLQILGTNYTLTGVGNSSGGTCTFTTAPTSTTGATISIYRDPPVTQTTSYNNNDPFPAKSHENALDKLTLLEQRARDLIARTISVPDGDPFVDYHLPTAALRQNKVLGFDSNGLPVATTGPAFVSTTEIGVAFVSTRAIAAVTIFNAAVLYIQTGGYSTAGDGGGARYKKGTGGGSFTDGSSTSWVPVFAEDIFNVKVFGAIGDGIANDTTALQATITAAAGKWVYMPAGTYLVTSQLTYITSGAGVGTFNAGLHLRGAGYDKTFIDNRVANNSVLYIGQNDQLGFQIGSVVSDLSIKTTSAQTASHGIEHRGCYQYLVENVHVNGLTGDGLRVTSSVGDLDASNLMTYRNVRVENCDIGLNCNFSTTIVQPSFMRVDNSFFSANRIGWRWIGLDGLSVNNGFAICTAIGLQIVNNSASNAQFTSINSSFENNLKSIDINSLQGGTFIQTELACGSAFAAQTQAVVMDNCIGVEFTGTRVRINNTPHTLWTLGAGATGNQIRNSFYQSYDAAGQVRYSVNASAFGNRLDDSFDAIQIGSQNGTTGVTCVNGANQNLALPLDGAMYSLGGPTGAFNIGGLTNGFSGRVLRVRNASGQTLTINAEDAGSTAANRIRTEGLANVTVANQGSFTLVYDGGDSRWHLFGKG